MEVAHFHFEVLTLISSLLNLSTTFQPFLLFHNLQTDALKTL